DAEFRHAREFLRRKFPRRQPGLEQRAPEIIAGMRVVRAFARRARAGGGTAKHHAQVRREHVGEDVLVTYGRAQHQRFLRSSTTVAPVPPCAGRAEANASTSSRRRRRRSTMRLSTGPALPERSPLPCTI